MIHTENITINGSELTRTYSDGGYYIQRDGVQYAEAIDPAELGRTYTETDEPIGMGTDEATVEDYQAALNEFGVEV